MAVNIIPYLVRYDKARLEIKKRPAKIMSKAKKRG